MTPPSPIRRRIRLEWYEDVRAPEQEWAVDRILPKQGLVAVYGESGAGKSFVALDWALRMSAGMAIMDARTEKMGALFVAAEGAYGIRKRIAAWRKHHRMIHPLPFGMIGECLDLRTATSADLQALIETLAASRNEFASLGAKLGLVVVDTLASVTPGVVENSSEGMGAAIHALRRLADALGVLVVIVHHTGHSETHRPRGWSGLLAAIDTSIEVAKTRKGNTRVIRLRKQKDGEDNRSLGAVCLEPVRVGDSDCESSASAIVRYIDSTSDPDETPVPLRPAEVRMLSAIQKALEVHGIPPSPGLSAQIPDLRRCVARSHVNRLFCGYGSADDCAPVLPLDAAQRQEASRALCGLKDRGLIDQHKISNREAYVWLTNGL